MNAGADKKRNGKERNKEFARVTYFFVLLFLALMGYLIYFTAVQAKTVVNSPYNKRQEKFAERVVRGDLVDRNGNILATTRTDESGQETRVYPYDDLFCHVIGYYNPKLGSTGLESAKNFDLLTSNAFFVERLQNEFRDQKNVGDTVVTTLDVDLQKAAYDALGNNKGAVVVLDAETSRVLAMVSKPCYDPNQIVEDWDTLNSDEKNSPLLNRATRGAYAPGSTFKLVTALAYMRQNQDYDAYSYDCSGKITEGDFTIRCFDGTAHGTENLRQSMANSCNASFAHIGLSLDQAEYRKTAENLLFNKELPGVLGASVSSFLLDQSSDAPEIMMTAMGQGKTMVSPYHLALITQAIANGGNMMEPYYVEKITNYTGSPVNKQVPNSYKKIMTSKEAAQLKEYMKAVVDEGTGSVLKGKSYTVAGKTGTAEYSQSDGEKTHSWFVGFTNVDNPELVISVITEGSDGSRSGKAVTIAGKVFDAYYK